MELQALSDHTQIGYDAIQIEFGYGYIGCNFKEIKMDTEKWYDHV